MEALNISMVSHITWQNGQFDLIHVFECRPVTIFPILFLIKKQKHVIFLPDWSDWWGRGGLMNDQRPFWYRPRFGPIETYFEDEFRKKADGITVIANSLSDRASRLGIDPKRICRIPQGVDTYFFKFLSMKKARENLGIN